MLSSRLILGFFLVALMVGVAWLDFHAWRPGVYLAPLGVLSVWLGAGELVRLFEENAATAATTDTPPGERLAPSRYVVVTGATLTMLISFAPALWATYPADCPVGRAGWVAIGLAAGVLLAVAVELARFQQPGVATIRLAQAVLAIAYCGGLMGFAAQLRLLGGGQWGDDGRWGMLALLSLIAVVKANDTGAYAAGRVFGKHPMTPRLSPGKTWEGFVSGALFSVAAAAICLGPLADYLRCSPAMANPAWALGAVAYGLVVGAAGVLGDLTISLLKRDSRLKNSSTWMPGFGGVLDVLDSILFAAPIAYLFWVAGVVGPAG
ncbi:MAG: phosphatidate cytidylyltransferase [Planctomycetota bacterium]